MRDIRKQEGAWIPVDEEPHEDYECSRCGYMASTWTANIKPEEEYKFCPNCGAKMTEEKRTCSDCIIDGTDACSRGAGRAIDDELCQDFIPEQTGPDLISRGDLIKHLSDWALSQSPDNEPNEAREYTAYNMQSMIYRTIQECIQAVQEIPSSCQRCEYFAEDKYSYCRRSISKDEETIEILQNEKRCVQTASANRCDRKCESCQLLRESEEIIAAIDSAIESIKDRSEEIEQSYTQGYLKGVNEGRGVFD